MPYGRQWLSKSKIISYAKDYASDNPNTEYEVALVLDALENHKLAEDKFLEFIVENKERKDNG